MTTQTVRSFCRICMASCGVTLTLQDGRITKVRGDREDPVSRGFVCFKGLQVVEQHYGKGRLKTSLRRLDGELKPAPAEEVLSEAGRSLKAIVDEHGPGSVAFFTGTQAAINTIDFMMIRAFADAVGTPRWFTTMTIDQSAKWIAEDRMGAWAAGPQTFSESDVWMFVGANPLVSMSMTGGPDFIFCVDPVKTIKELRKRGMRLIVIDPRRTETAEFADIFLQPRPGRDAELAASILHVILREEWYDEAFCTEYVNGLDRLRDLVAPYSPEICADWIGVDSTEIETAAAAFARDADSGMAGTGSGPDMARFSNLAEHLFQAINIVCGRFPREGDPVANPGVFQPFQTPHADVRPPFRGWETGPRSESHGLGMIRGGMMSAEIADDILHQGKNPIRAMICVGGNPAVALPDQARAEKALENLELLIVVDPRLSATARFADYVIAPTLQYERADHTSLVERGFQVPFGHATPAIVSPPEGADVVDSAHALWAIAREAGYELAIGDYKISTEEAPTREQLLSVAAGAGRVSFDEALRAGCGRIFPSDEMTVGPRTSDARFELVPEDVAGELKELTDQFMRPKMEYRTDNRFQLIVRRHREMMNSTASDFDATWHRLRGNPAYLHPEDLQRLGLEAGDTVEVLRGNVGLTAKVKPDKGLRPGVISMGHAWPGVKSKPWEATNALVHADSDVQTINRMPIMTGFEVEIRKVSQ